MADPFIAEIRMVPFHFPPKGWAWCSGQLIPVSQNTALFALLGTTYGGNGKSNFALPNLDGRAPMHPGQGPGLSLHDLGEEGGTEMVKLLESEMPPHSHSIRADGGQSTVNSPEAAFVSATNRPGYATNTGGGKKLNESSISPAGGDQPHNNMMPYLTVHFCIAIQGVFPPRY